MRLAEGLCRFWMVGALVSIFLVVCVASVLPLLYERAIGIKVVKW